MRKPRAKPRKRRIWIRLLGLIPIGNKDRHMNVLCALITQEEFNALEEAKQLRWTSSLGYHGGWLLSY